VEEQGAYQPQHADSGVRNGKPWQSVCPKLAAAERRRQPSWRAPLFDERQVIHRHVDIVLVRRGIGRRSLIPLE
jgi:hypothetical protein